MCVLADNRIKQILITIYMKQTKVLLTLWLTIAATGVWAEHLPAAEGKRL